MPVGTKFLLYPCRQEAALRELQWESDLLRPKNTLHPKLQNIAVIGTLSKVFVVPVSVGSLLCSIHGFHAVIVQLSSRAPQNNLPNNLFRVYAGSSWFLCSEWLTLLALVVDIVISGPKQPTSPFPKVQKGVVSSIDCTQLVSAVQFGKNRDHNYILKLFGSFSNGLSRFSLVIVVIHGHLQSVKLAILFCTSSIHDNVDYFYV